MRFGHMWGLVEEGAEWPFAQEKVFGAAPVRSDGARSTARKTP